MAARLLNTDGESLEVWNIKTQTRMGSRLPIDAKGKKGKWTGFAFTHDNHTLAISHYLKQDKRSQILLWNLETDTAEPLHETQGKIYNLSFSPDDRLLFFSEMRAKKSYVSCWDRIERKDRYAFEGTAVAYCPQTQLIAKGAAGSLSLLQLDGRDEFNLLSGLHDRRPRLIVTDLKFSADGRRLAARVVPLEVIITGHGGFAFFNDPLATLHLWEIGTTPYLHARLIDKLPHELIGRGAKFDEQNGLLNDITKRLLIEKEAQLNPTSLQLVE